MTRLIVRRLFLIIPTLFLVSILIFALSEVLPGDVGRTILGPYATPAQVKALDHQLGADKPMVQRYFSWIGRFVTGNWGQSQVLQQSVRPLVIGHLLNSLLLAGLALVIIVPTSLVLGVVAGLRQDGLLDRAITTITLSLTVIPEFVSGVILLVLFAVAVHWFPVTAAAPPGANLGTRLYYLILPSIPLMFIEMGYIARMARIGVVENLAMPYVRTAVLKGLPKRRVVFHHILRNAMVPTVTVIGSQIGWLVGGLVVVETLFNYPGIGNLMLTSANAHDVLVLEASVLCVAAIYMFSNLTADVIVALLSPRIRKRG
ncbi:MAG: ABC transporter permease [Thermoleophilia bacterium]